MLAKVTNRVRNVYAKKVTTCQVKFSEEDRHPFYESFLVFTPFIFRLLHLIDRTAGGVTGQGGERCDDIQQRQARALIPAKCSAFLNIMLAGHIIRALLNVDKWLVTSWCLVWACFDIPHKVLF